MQKKKPQQQQQLKAPLPDDVDPFQPRIPSTTDDDSSLSDGEDDEQRMPMPELVSVPGVAPALYKETEFEVERILMVQTKARKQYFLIDWKGYPLNECSWVPKANLNCEEVIKTFNDRRELCKMIYSKLLDKESYKGFEDLYVTGIITPSFIEQNLMEVTLAPFMKVNGWAPLIVENWTRFNNCFPEDFNWIARNVFSKKAAADNKNITQPQQVCECGDVCKPQSCSCLKSCIKVNGDLRKDSGVFVYECNDKCRCGSKCPGKISQKGRKHAVMLFRNPRIGWGVRAMVPIPKNKFVIEYAGIIKKFEECENVKDQTYLFNCSFHKGSSQYVIDATDFGNESRFINHHCKPNLKAQSILGGHPNPGVTRIGFYTSRNILPGEELTFNYFAHQIDLDKIVPGDTKRCKCGASNCRQYLA